jgi:hypothetical protein
VQLPSSTALWLRGQAWLPSTAGELALPGDLFAPEPHIQSVLGAGVAYLARGRAALPQELLHQLGVVVQLGAEVVLKVGLRASGSGSSEYLLPCLAGWLRCLQDRNLGRPI